MRLIIFLILVVTCSAACGNNNQAALKQKQLALKADSVSRQRFKTLKFMVDNKPALAIIDTRYKDFYWQGGYGAFSASPQSLEIVQQYIESQHVHHKTTTFQDEYRRILREHDIEFDERFVWD